MNEKLTRVEVEHVAHLARIALSEEEIEKYQVDLKKLMNEIDKIKLVEGYDKNMMFSPVCDSAFLRSDEKGEMLTSKEALANVPKKNGNFIEVPVMINE